MIDGSLRFWGKSEAFQCSLESQPQGTYSEISANGHHLLAREQGGKIVGWGPNIGNYNWGQTSQFPHLNFAAFSAGHWHSVALNSAGQWVDQGPDYWGPDSRQTSGPAAGGNAWGQCGYSPDPNQTCGNNQTACGESACVSNPCYSAPPLPMPVMTHIDGGYFQNTARTQYGGLIAWGRNTESRLAVPTGHFIAFSAKFDHGLAIHGCYANCDGSTTPPVLNVNDFSCFNNAFAAGDTYANCDGSTTPPVLNVADFACFNNLYSAGCIRP